MVDSAAKSAWLDKPEKAAYTVWSGMKTRCRNPKSAKYKFYGGRGITVCERWTASYADFYADMGPRPEGATLDRIDSNGNYEPGDCRWATWEEQHNNKRSNRPLTIGARTQTIAQWAREIGIHPHTLGGRLERGWPNDRLSDPPHLPVGLPRSPAVPPSEEKKPSA